jgi:hypothetical protein
MKDIQPDELSPKDALDTLYKLKRATNRSNWLTATSSQQILSKYKFTDAD